MSSQPKLSSRLSSLNMFGKFTSSSSKPPPPVEKDPWYQSGGSKSAVSLAPSQAFSIQSSSIASMSVETLQLPQTPLSTSTHSQCDLSRVMTPVSTRSRTTTMTASTVQSQASELSSFRRGISKLSNSLGKKSRLFLRSNSSRTTLSMDSMRSSQDGMVSESGSDDSISRPWNVQHHLHVDEGLANLPPDWLDKLRQEGFKDTEALSFHSRRNRTTYLKNHPDVSIDVMSARANRSPYTPTSTTTSPSSLLLPKSSLPARSTSLRRPTTVTSDSTSGRSGGSSRSPDSTSPPSSYGFSLSGAPSDSSVSSRAPSPYADGDSDECPDPGTATASQFMVSAAPTSVAAPRGLPQLDSSIGDPPARAPPSRTATLTFVVTNPTPPSPPPAYDHSEPNNVQTQSYPRDEKRDLSVSNSSSRNDRRASSSAVQQSERRSEETLTPEVLLRSESEDVTHQCRITEPEDENETGAHTRASPPPFRLHLHKPSRDESSPSKPSKRTDALPPRLSLHQDDLSDWSAELFSVISTPEPELGSFSEASGSASPAPTSNSVVEAIPTEPKKSSPRIKKIPVPPLVLTPANDIPRVTIETDDDETLETGSETVEHGAGTSTTPLFDEVLSLVRQPTTSTTPNGSPPLTSTYPYLPSPPPTYSPDRSSQRSLNTSPSPSHSPNVTYDFLKEHYDPHRASTVSSTAGSRESQATISGSSRWSRATTVRDVRDATIAVAHVRKPSVANAMTVPAPMPGRHTPQTSVSSIVRSEGSGRSSDGSRPMSSASSDGVCIPSASDFPLPPPSPGDFSISSVQPSPMSGKFSVVSDDVRLPYTTDSASINGPSSPAFVERVPSPASARSSQSSSRSGSSTSSSQVNPLSVSSGSDEGPEHHDSDAVRVELRCSVLSPTDSTVSEVDPAKWGPGQNKLRPPSHVDIAPRIFTTDADNDEVHDRVSCCYHSSVVPDGASAVVGWFDDAPSPEFDPRDKPIRDSGTLYNLIGEPSPHILLKLNSPDRDRGSPQIRRPSLQINGIAKPDSQEKPLTRLSADVSPAGSSSVSPSSTTPSPSPLERYCGWVSEVVAPLEEFIDHTVDPREVFTDLLEIAEGESGSVFSATVVPLPPPVMKAKSIMVALKKARRTGKAAVKQVPLLPGGSPKLEDLRKELMLMSQVSHTHILSMDALYVDLVDDALWIEMELMERSLADVLALAEEGLILEEKVIARFTGDILGALAHLETLGVVHRDVRSDNLLVNSQGVLKLADFSNALLIDSAYPLRTDSAGVIYWQAPEMRNGSGKYDARKVDIWSVGATAWEMAEAEPPFLNMEITDPRQLPDRLPALSNSDAYSRSFHDFLTLCSNPVSSRPSADDLLMTPFVYSSCARSLIVDLLSQCRSIEERKLRRASTDSQDTILS